MDRTSQARNRKTASPHGRIQVHKTYYLKQGISENQFICQKGRYMVNYKSNINVIKK